LDDHPCELLPAMLGGACGCGESSPADDEDAMGDGWEPSAVVS